MTFSYDDEFDDPLKNPQVIARIRSNLRTKEQRKYFDFVTDIPKDFAMKYAGTRWTHERIADYLDIPQDRLPSLNKALRRAFNKVLPHIK